MGKNNQTELFVTQTMAMAGNREESLAHLLDKFIKGRLRLPPFQRKFVWKDDKVRGWSNSIMQQIAIGVVVTYQVHADAPDYPVYLADGRQRLGATEKILKDPALFGMNDLHHAQSYLENFSVTVQHRIYNTHDEAWEAFQLLNNGTQVTPADYFKGEIANLPDGDVLYEDIIEAVRDMDADLVKTLPKRYETWSKYDRQAVALFYQYLSGYKEKNLWKAAITVHKHDSPSAERLLAQYIRENGNVKTREQLKYFVAFCWGERAHIVEVLKATRRTDKISHSLFRGLLAFSIWRRNSGIPVEVQSNMLEVVFKNSQDLSTTVDYVKPDGNPGRENIQIDNLQHILNVARWYNIEALENKRKAKKSSKRGYDVSHIQPFSLFGEGETILEPAPLNRARGAKPITKNEPQSH